MIYKTGEGAKIPENGWRRRRFTITDKLADFY